MAKSDLKKFRELMITDTEFQGKLREAAESYTGELGDRPVFENVILPFAKEYGLSATYEEFVEFMGAFTGNGGDELSEDELEMVAGGKGVCLVIGGSDGPDADGYVGPDVLEAHACYYFGIGIILPSL